MDTRRNDVPKGGSGAKEEEKDEAFRPRRSRWATSSGWLNRSGIARKATPTSSHSRSCSSSSGGSLTTVKQILPGDDDDDDESVRVAKVKVRVGLTSPCRGFVLAGLP